MGIFSTATFKLWALGRILGLEQDFYFVGYGWTGIRIHSHVHFFSATLGVCTDLLLEGLGPWHPQSLCLVFYEIRLGFQLVGLVRRA